MSFLPLALFLSGYTVSWYGWTTLRGPGMGIKDLISPSQVDFCNGWLSTPVSKLKSAYTPAPLPAITWPTNSANGGNGPPPGVIETSAPTGQVLA